MQVQSDSKPYDDINITPMLDLAYVLLVIFIIMTTATVQGQKVNLPKASAAPSLATQTTKAITVANDGKIYVCDRGNDRIQVFDKNSPELGKPCSNPNGEAGKCGFVSEQGISEHTETLPVMPGTAVSMNFSTDKAQSCVYVGDNTNQTIYILDRASMGELGRFGQAGRMAGDFHWLHQVSLDSKGNVYTAEVDTGKRIQKFIRSGALGCTGRGAGTVGGVAQ